MTDPYKTVSQGFLGHVKNFHGHIHVATASFTFRERPQLLEFPWVVQGQHQRHVCLGALVAPGAVLLPPGLHTEPVRGSQVPGQEQTYRTPDERGEQGMPRLGQVV